MVKLSLAILFFLVSLLTVFRAPVYFLWLLAILVDEFPWIFVILTVVLILFDLRSPAYPLASNLLILTSLALFTSPIIRASHISKDLRANMDEVFKHPEPDASGSHLIFQTASMFGKTLVAPFHKLTYKTSDKKDITLDFYPSQHAGKRPCVIVVHGGSWKSGDNKQLPELNSYLARNGYHVAAINYRLAPAFQSPAPVEDVRDALRFLKLNAKKWKIDTSQFVLLGRSAGAQIALLAAYTLNEPDIKGVIDFYGPADMIWGYSIPSNPLIMDSRKVMEDYLGGTYHVNPLNYERSSPIRYVSPKSPPTLIIHGENDVLVAYEHSRRLNLKLQEFGVPHYLLTLPWATHGFDYNLNGPGGQISTYAVHHFLQSVTR